MADDLPCGSKVIKYLLFFFNFIFWCSGVVLLGIGIWMLVDHGSTNYYLNVAAGLDYGLAKAAAINIIVVGSLVFIVGGLGCCGACKESVGCLTAFSWIMIILLVLQIIAISLAAAFHTQIVNQLEKEMTKTLASKYGQSGNESTTTSWNYMQMEMHCCGVRGPENWINSSWSTDPKNVGHVPASCCIELNDPSNYSSPSAKDQTACDHDAFNMTMQDKRYAYTDGCEMELTQWFKGQIGVIVTGTAIVIITQVVIVIMACILKSKIKTLKTYEHV